MTKCENCGRVASWFLTENTRPDEPTCYVRNSVECWRSKAEMIQAEHTEMLALLRKLESTEDHPRFNGLRVCPRCFGAVEYQHQPGCDLAELLARIDAREKGGG